MNELRAKRVGREAVLLPAYDATPTRAKGF